MADATLQRLVALLQIRGLLHEADYYTIKSLVLAEDARALSVLNDPRLQSNLIADANAVDLLRSLAGTMLQNIENPIELTCSPHAIPLCIRLSSAGVRNTIRHSFCCGKRGRQQGCIAEGA
jgi:hypothetical protein